MDWERLRTRERLRSQERAERDAAAHGRAWKRHEQREREREIAELKRRGYGCPACDGALMKRRNRTTGEFFRGCSNFPRCKRTTPFAASSGHRDRAHVGLG